MDTRAGRIFLNEEQYNTVKSFDRLVMMKEEYLSGDGMMNIRPEQSVYEVLIPVTGDLVYHDIHSGRHEVEVGQVMVSQISAGGSFKINNPYPDEEICFIHLRIICGEPVLPGRAQVTSFDLNRAGGHLTDILKTCKEDAPPFKLSMGQFAGRQEVIYKIKKTSEGLFCFAVAGAFEIEGRLLHPKDGLALWDIGYAEIEALSNHALLLIAEI